MNADEVRRHVAWKRDGERTLPAAIADAMLAALDAGAAPDYLALRRAAQWPPIPTPVFHTADRANRASIAADGLRVGRPSEGNWSRLACEIGQPVGVYVSAVPDHLGMWSHWSRHDVWAVDPAGLSVEVDELNPGCWVILDPVPPGRLALVPSPAHGAGRGLPSDPPPSPGPGVSDDPGV